MGRIFGKIQLSFITVLLFALNGFAGGAIAGKVTIVKGQVFILRSGEKIQVKKDITVLESDVIESQPGGTARITMIDSNLVDVYPKSKVEIAKYVYKPNQDQKDVELKVDFGKIKSTVNQKYDGAKNKFQVKTPSAVAGVRGTVFIAEYDAVKKVSKVITIEGLVAVTKIIDRERQTPPVFVRPDQVVKVDAEQPKTEQPRDLKSDEREEHKQEDKDLGYQYDPKKEPTPSEAPSSKNDSPTPGKDQPPKEFDRLVKDVQASEPARELPPIKDEQVARQPVKEFERPTKDVQVREPVRETPPIKEISVREPVNSDKEERREQPQTLREAIKDAVKNVSDHRQERQAEQQEKRQTASEDQQAKKQKQTEDEQAKKQKQLEEEQARKQKQSEEEQVKKQKQMEEEQARKQKQSEDEQNKKQKQAEEEQVKKQKQMEDMLAAKRKHAEEAQAKREEEQQRRAEEQQARRAELARRLAEIAKRAEETVIRLPSGTTDGSTGGSTTPISPINTIIPHQ